MRSARRLAAGLFAALSLGLGACGGDDDDGGGAENPQTQTPAGVGQTQAPETQQAVDGKQIFTDNCGSCHVLADAGTEGQTGPNLDEAQPDLATVQRQVINGGGGMPAFQGRLAQEEIDPVAAYAAENAGGS